MQISGHNPQKLIEQFQSPLYVYNQTTIQNRCQQLLDGLKCFPNQTKAIYACKANTNPHILKLMYQAGIHGIDTVSVGECQIALKCGFNAEDILYTANYISDSEIEWAIQNKILLNIGELDTLEKIGKKYPGTEVAIRINPDIGSGECANVITGGPLSKFGIYFSQYKEIIEVAEKYSIKIVGIHQHIGSNICQNAITDYVNSAKCILETSLHFQKDLRFINIGGGIGVPYKAQDQSLDLKKAFEEVSKLYIEIYRNNAQKDIDIWVEPGRFFVAESGSLLSTVTAVKDNSHRTFVGLDTGMNHLVRPAFYGSYHHIVNVSRPDGEKVSVDICGNICESSDIFAKDREISKPQQGDILQIQAAGAYCFSMSSNYNTRERPAEVLVSENSSEIKLIRRRENLEDLLAQVPEF